MTDRQEGRNEPHAVPFGRKFANSDAFQLLFREGMGLTEETARYLDGPGRREARDLPWDLALAYAAESMRLTKRLIHLVSWLLLQRAVREGDMMLAQADQEKHKVRVQNLMAETGNLTGLPDSLLRLIERSLRLQERVQHLDAMLYGKPAFHGENAVANYLARLNAAFGPA